MSHLHDTEIWALGAGELSAEQEQIAAKHLADCASCRRELAVVSRFRTSAQETGRTPSAFESARMGKRLREQVQQQTRAQRQAWLPSRVAAAVAFATLSGGAVAMTASGAWPIFSQPREAITEPADRSSSPRPALKSPMRPKAVVEEEPAAATDGSEIAAPDAFVATSQVQTSLMTYPTPPQHTTSPGATNRRGRAPESASRGPRSRTVSQRSSPAETETPSARDNAAAAASQSGDASGIKIAMLSVATDAPPFSPGAAAGDERQVQIAPGTPSPLEVLQAEEQRLLRENQAEGWLSVGDAYIQMANTTGAELAYVQALAGFEGGTAGQRLQTMVSKGLSTEHALLAAVLAHEGAARSREGMRWLCEWSLKVRPDRQAVRHCQAFGQAYPAHPAVHRLALTAGLVAENHLQDWELAVEEYSRALVVSEFAELPSSDALFFRARARARLGQIQEARADLRLFLHVDSSSWNRKEVDDLIHTLQIPRE